MEVTIGADDILPRTQWPTCCARRPSALVSITSKAPDKKRRDEDDSLFTQNLRFTGHYSIGDLGALALYTTSTAVQVNIFLMWLAAAASYAILSCC